MPPRGPRSPDTLCLGRAGSRPRAPGFRACTAAGQRLRGARGAPCAARGAGGTGAAGWEPLGSPGCSRREGPPAPRPPGPPRLRIGPEGDGAGPEPLYTPPRRRPTRTVLKFSESLCCYEFLLKTEELSHLPKCAKDLQLCPIHAWKGENPVILA